MKVLFPDVTDWSDSHIRANRSVSPTFFDNIPKGFFDGRAVAGAETRESTKPSPSPSAVSSASTESTTVSEMVYDYEVPADYQPGMTSSWSSATTIRVQSSMKFRVKKVCKTLKQKIQGKDESQDYYSYF
jgi:hypothetical protein